MSSSSWVVLSFSVLEVQVSFTQRGAACPGHCTCRSSSNSLEKCDGFVGCLVWVSQVASDRVFGGVWTVMLDLGQHNMHEISNLSYSHMYTRSKTEIQEAGLLPIPFLALIFLFFLSLNDVHSCSRTVIALLQSAGSVLWGEPVG